jgi:hypothetical protein
MHNAKFNSTACISKRSCFHAEVVIAYLKGLQCIKVKADATTVSGGAVETFLK